MVDKTICGRMLKVRINKNKKDDFYYRVMLTDDTDITPLLFTEAEVKNFVIQESTSTAYGTYTDTVINKVKGIVTTLLVWTPDGSTVTTFDIKKVKRINKNKITAGTDIQSDITPFGMWKEISVFIPGTVITAATKRAT